MITFPVFNSIDAIDDTSIYGKSVRHCQVCECVVGDRMLCSFDIEYFVNVPERGYHLDDIEKGETTSFRKGVRESEKIEFSKKKESITIDRVCPDCISHLQEINSGEYKNKIFSQGWPGSEAESMAVCRDCAVGRGRSCVKPAYCFSLGAEYTGPDSSDEAIKKSKCRLHQLEDEIKRFFPEYEMGGWGGRNELADPNATAVYRHDLRTSIFRVNYASREYRINDLVLIPELTHASELRVKRQNREREERVAREVQRRLDETRARIAEREIVKIEYSKSAFERQNAITESVAFRSGIEWTEEDMSVILQSDLTLYQKAISNGRTMKETKAKLAEIARKSKAGVDI